ncbi:MAG: hypothetical protein K0S11_709 [Gammaproteobacteria bacterium]|nr:hypothetical protein [Gammaproteobacteria bacterium]
MQLASNYGSCDIPASITSLPFHHPLSINDDVDLLFIEHDQLTQTITAPDNQRTALNLAAGYLATAFVLGNGLGNGAVASFAMKQLAEQQKLPLTQQHLLMLSAGLTKALMAIGTDWQFTRDLFEKLGNKSENVWRYLTNKNTELNNEQTPEQRNLRAILLGQSKIRDVILVGAIACYGTAVGGCLTWEGVSATFGTIDGLSTPALTTLVVVITSIEAACNFSTMYTYISETLPSLPAIAAIKDQMKRWSSLSWNEFKESLSNSLCLRSIVSKTLAIPIIGIPCLINAANTSYGLKLLATKRGCSLKTVETIVYSNMIFKTLQNISMEGSSALEVFKNIGNMAWRGLQNLKNPQRFFTVSNLANCLDKDLDLIKYIGVVFGAAIAIYGSSQDGVLNFLASQDILESFKSFDSKTILGMSIVAAILDSASTLFFDGRFTFQQCSKVAGMIESWLKQSRPQNLPPHESPIATYGMEANDADQTQDLYEGVFRMV